MPTLSIFDGIKILMYYREHFPPTFTLNAATTQQKSALTRS